MFDPSAAGPVLEIFVGETLDSIYIAKLRAIMLIACSGCFVVIDLSKALPIRLRKHGMVERLP
ncbi:hypothetical protein O8B93_11955 [Agrobacterium rhizogenes]|nr:hypothetical protein [Rhizobium rhizogenes]